MTPSMSPLPHDDPLIEKPGLGQIQEESEGAGFKVLPGKGLIICLVFVLSPPVLHRFHTYSFLPLPYHVCGLSVASPFSEVS